MENPVSADENGINLKPEKMEKEKLYHCIFKIMQCWFSKILKMY